MSFQNFLLGASHKIYLATDKRAQFSSVHLQVPSSWTSCNSSLPLKRLPRRSADVFVEVGNDLEAIQPEGCASRGLRIDLGMDLVNGDSESAKLAFAAEWLKLRYGVFDEHGYDGSATFPLFYSSLGTVLPTGCTNTPVKGPFGDECLTSPGSCALPPGQPVNLTSSLLYEPDLSVFPGMATACNSQTHNQDAPTRQNLLCFYKSAMEVMMQDSDFASSERPEFLAPEVTVSIDKEDSDEGEFILVIDGALSQSQWTTLRLGLAQLFIGLTGGARLSLIRNGFVEVSNQTVMSGIDLWGAQYFPENVVSGPPLDMSAAFNLVEQELAKFDSPNVMVMTKTAAVNEDLSGPLALIREHRLQVDILTFSDVQYPALIELAIFGRVFAIPSDYNHITDQAYHSGTALLQTLADLRNRNLQQVVLKMEEERTGLSSVITGSFELKSHVSSQSNPSFFQIVLLSPWSSLLADISVTDPDGHVYQGIFGANVPFKWNFHVFYVKEPQFKTGTWSYSVTPSASAGAADGELFIVVTVDTEDGLGVEGEVESVVRGGGFNATQSYAVSLFGEITGAVPANVDADKLTVKTYVMDPREFPPAILVPLKNDGLSMPDISDLDRVYSEYFLEIFNPGFYSLRYWLTSSGDVDFNRYIIGPSFYLTGARDPQKDTVPPSRITDLRVLTYSPPSALITLQWTAPGDNLNDGSASYYKIYCGPARDELTFDDCTATRGGSLVLFAHEAGSEEGLNTTLAVLGTQVFFGVRAFDDAGNSGPMSNAAPAFVEGEPPVTTPAPTQSKNFKAENNLL